MRKLFLVSCLGLLISSCHSSPHRSTATVASESEAPLKPDDPTVEKTFALFKSVMVNRHGTPTERKIYLGQKLAQRAVFLKTQGCAKGTFAVTPNLPTEWRVGLFKAEIVKPAYLRVSSDTTPNTPDQQNSTNGIAIKVMNVPGTKILAGEESFQTQDFLLQNHHVFFVDNAKDFFRLFGDQDAFSKENPALFQRYMKILDVDMPKAVSNLLQVNYWSTTPYRFGSTYAKYKVIPCTQPVYPSRSLENSPNYLATRFEQDVKNQGACLQLQVQLQTQPEKMPLDKATQEWDETLSVPKTLATLSFPRQDIANNAMACEKMSFTAWHALPDHEPVGSVNQMRQFVYKWMADYRRKEMNQWPITEPSK